METIKTWIINPMKIAVISDLIKTKCRLEKLDNKKYNIINLQKIKNKNKH